jgi:hypothetical protein
VKRTLAGVVALALLGGGIVLLRAELMTVHRETPADSRTAFVIDARTREAPRHLEEMTRGLVSVCRLLVNSDVVERSFAELGGGRYTFDLEPALDEFDLREMRGCLQDTRVQHLLVDVRFAESQGV